MIDEGGFSAAAYAAYVDAAVAAAAAERKWQAERMMEYIRGLL